MNDIVQQGAPALLLALVIVHFIADFPLQGEYLARNKVRASAGSTADWGIALFAHSAIHAGGVWLVTGSLAVGLIEFFLHGLIDFTKGMGKFGNLADQLLHICCKLGYVVVFSISEPSWMFCL